MQPLAIPGFGTLELEHLVLDYNGTIAEDGALIPGVSERLRTLATELTVHVITADTFGSVRKRMADLPVTLHILGEGREDEGKLAYVRSLSEDTVASVGNGRIDRLMLRESALGIAVIGPEGAAAATLMAADVVCTGIGEALDLLTRPLRLRATLRS